MTREELIEAQAKLGMTIPQLADFLKVAETTVRAWRKTTATRRNVPGPAEVAIHLEMKRRGIA